MGNRSSPLFLKSKKKKITTYFLSYCADDSQHMVSLKMYHKVNSILKVVGTTHMVVFLTRSSPEHIRHLYQSLNSASLFLVKYLFSKECTTHPALNRHFALHLLLILLFHLTNQRIAFRLALTHSFSIHENAHMHASTTDQPFIGTKPHFPKAFLGYFSISEPWTCTCVLPVMKSYILPDTTQSDLPLP